MKKICVNLKIALARRKMVHALKFCRALAVEYTGCKSVMIIEVTSQNENQSCITFFDLTGSPFIKSKECFVPLEQLSDFIAAHYELAILLGFTEYGKKLLTDNKNFDIIQVVISGDKKCPEKTIKNIIDKLKYHQED